MPLFFRKEDKQAVADAAFALHVEITGGRKSGIHLPLAVGHDSRIGYSAGRGRMPMWVNIVDTGKLLHRVQPRNAWPPSIARIFDEIVEFIAARLVGLSCFVLPAHIASLGEREGLNQDAFFGGSRLTAFSGNMRS